MTSIPVIFCFDDRILLGAGVSILSMLDHAAESTEYDIRILHPGLNDSIQQSLLKLVAETRHSMQFHEIPSSRFDGVPKNRGSWTEIVYYRLLASEFLPDCDKALYSDVDVFFKRDMAEVFNIDLSQHEWAGVVAEANRPDNTMHRYFPENPKSVIHFSGFMVMNLQAMRENGAVARYFETIETVGDRLKFFDLDLLNIATPSIAPVPFDYVVLEDIYETEDLASAKEFGFLSSVYSKEALQASRDAPAIIHYAGPRGKPWQRQSMPDYYRAVVNRLPKQLQKRTFRDWRKTWLSKKGWRKFPVRTK
jgi:lipopolysaccharide biosynthesis glycosyltransferase